MLVIRPSAIFSSSPQQASHIGQMRWATVSEGWVVRIAGSGRWSYLPRLWAPCGGRAITSRVMWRKSPGWWFRAEGTVLWPAKKLTERIRMPGVLDGVKVIEFGQNLAGPYCGQILAFMGAEVIKIEKPEGDDARKWGPPFIDGDAVGFIALNRGKIGRAHV